MSATHGPEGDLPDDRSSPAGARSGRGHVRDPRPDDDPRRRVRAAGRAGVDRLDRCRRSRRRRCPWRPTRSSRRPSPRPSRRNRGRWIAAIAVVALVIGASAAIALALTASSGQSTVVGYVPADSIAYVEVRLDLPGDQRAELAEFLSKFPGFADQAALETKLDEVLDELLQQATDGQQTFSTDIKPWFDGEIAVALGDPAQPRRPRKDGPGLALISIKDEALANAWLDGVLAESRRDPHDRDLRRHPGRARGPSRRPARPPPSPSSTARSPSPAMTSRSRRRSTPTGPAASPTRPTSRPPWPRSRATTSASASSTCSRCWSPPRTCSARAWPRPS